MSSIPANIDKPLELIQKTYNLQATTTTTNNHENLVLQSRPSIAKVSTHQPSRKSSIHDIHEVTRDDLNKILHDIQSNLSRLKFLLESMISISTVRDELFKLKDQLMLKILEFISKLSNESTRRGSIISKINSSSLITYHPQHLVYCIEYFRNELFKCKYLILSLTNSIETITLLNSIEINSYFDQTINDDHHHHQDIQIKQDFIQIKKDISILEEHAYGLTQRYYSQIPDWNQFDQINEEKVKNDLINPLPNYHLKLNPKLSTTSSIASFDNSHFSTRIYQKCRNICCLCTPNYI